MHLEQSAHAPAGLLISKPLWGVAWGSHSSEPDHSPLTSTGILQGLSQAIKAASFIFLRTASLELRILDLFEALHATLHLLRSRIVSALRVLVNV